MSDEILQHLLASLWRVALGFQIGFTLAAVASLAILSFPQLRLITWGFEALRSIPPIAWTPLAIVAFGLGTPSALFIVALGAFFPLLSAFTLAIETFPRSFADVAQQLQLSPRQTLLLTRVPHALPILFSGMRTALGMAWMCVVAAELTGATSGLGYAIQAARYSLRTDLVLLYMAIIGAVGLLTQLLLSALEQRVTPWRFNDAGRSRYRCKTNQNQAQHLTAKIEIDDATVSLNEGGSIIRNVNLSIRAGLAVALIGQSGSGKSTLLRAVAGLEKITSGSCTANAQAALVGNSVPLLPWLTLWDNVALAASCAHEELVMLLEEFGLSELRDRYPHTLSSGQEQRAQLLRGLCQRRAILLLDEPTARLDIVTKQKVHSALMRYITVNKPILLLVTHDLHEAEMFCDEVMVMSDGTLNKIARGKDENEIRPTIHTVLTHELLRHDDRLQSERRVQA